MCPLCCNTTGTHIPSWLHLLRITHFTHLVVLHIFPKVAYTQEGRDLSRVQYIYTLTYTHSHRHTHTYTHTYTHSHIHTHIYTLTFTHSHIHTTLHTHIYTSTHTHTHTHINTHKHAHSQRGGLSELRQAGRRRAPGACLPRLIIRAFSLNARVSSYASLRQTLFPT